MLRLIAALCLATLLSGCVVTEFDAKTSQAGNLPDLTGHYDMVVGANFVDQTESPMKDAIADLRREGNHYVVRIAAQDGSGPAPKDETIYIAGSKDKLVLVYSNEQAGMRGSALNGRLPEDGSIEVLIASNAKEAPSDALKAAFKAHGYQVSQGTFSPQLVGPTDLSTLAAALWDPVVVASYRPEVLFVLTRLPD